MQRLKLFFVGVVIVWFLSVWFVPTVLTRIVGMQSNDCVTAKEAQCNSYFSRIGQTGDLFGAVTSLFSALGIFAVAATFWFEAKTAREARKPLVVCKIDDESITLDRPGFGTHKNLRVVLDTTVENLGEPALNITMVANISAKGRSVELSHHRVQIPLAASGNAPAQVALVLQGEDLTALIDSLLHGQDVEMSLTLQYSSLESVVWITSVIYLLKCGTQAKSQLTAMQGSDADEFERLWSGGAAAGLRVELKPDSWSHRPLQA